MVIGILVAVGLGLAACSGDQVQTVVVTEVVHPQIVRGVTPDLQQYSGDAFTIIMCLSAEPDAPLIFSTTSAAREILSAATRSSWQIDGAYSYESPLLESFPSLENGDLVISEQPDGTRSVEAIFRFKEGITWSDGEPFTALDAAQTFYVIRFRVTGDDYDIPVEVEVEDDRTIRLVSQVGSSDQRYPFSPEEEWLLPFGSLYHDGGTVFFPEHSFLSPIPQSILTEESFVLDLPNPTLGPYEFLGWEPGDHIRLEGYDLWWGGVVRTPELVYRFIPDREQLLPLLLSGQCDYLTHDGLALDQLPFVQQLSADELLEYQVIQSPLWEHLTFNVAPPPDAPNGGVPFFADPRVRQAIAYGTDRQRMADEILYGEGRVMDSYLPEEHWAYSPEAAGRYSYDPDRARQLLFEAGWRDLDGDGLLEAYTDLTGEYACRQGKWTVPAGAFFEVDYHYPADNPMRQQIAGIFVENMAEIGITVNPVSVPPSEFFIGSLLGEGYRMPARDGETVPEQQSDTDGLMARRAFQIANFAWAAEPDPDAWFEYGGANIYQTPDGAYVDGATLLDLNPFLLQGIAIYEKDFVAGHFDTRLLPPGYTLVASDQIPSQADNFEGANSGGWCNPAASQQLFDGSRELDWTKRAPYYQEFQRYFVEELPALPLFQHIEIDAFSPFLCGPQRGPLQYASWNVETWYFHPSGQCQ